MSEPIEFVVGWAAVILFVIIVARIYRRRRR